MTFTSAIKTCLRKYVVFSGRASRGEFWWFVLFVIVGSIMAEVIDRAIYGDDLIEKVIFDEQTYAMIRHNGPVESTFWLLMVLPFLAAGWRRVHDTGRTGFLLLAPFVVVLGVGIFHVFVMLSQDTQAWANDGSIMIPFYIAGLLALLLSICWVLWLLTRPGQPGTSNYGPNPHEVTT